MDLEVTPKGEFKTMPADCTALDFAFSIHTFLGSHCIGAKVNHKLVPLSHKLQSGDQVEILTSKTQRVQKEWINFATTAKAKNKIQAILRREERELQKQGEEMLNEFFEKAEKLCSKNALIVCDNILMKAFLVDLSIDRKRRHRTSVKRMNEFLEYVHSRKDLEVSLLSCGDGLLLIKENKK